MLGGIQLYQDDTFVRVFVRWWPSDASRRVGWRASKFGAVASELLGDRTGADASPALSLPPRFAD